MKNLILIRHAKSSWNPPMQDIDRPLAPRGIVDAELVAIESLKYLPPGCIILSSSAKRARETAIIFAYSIQYPVKSIVYSDNLYTFDENKLENVIKSLRNDFENVILFGHNEAITNFVNKFGDIFIDNVPTAGLVWLHFETNGWDKIVKAKTLKTIFPKTLK